jgi:choline dehydrogenase-like flavoprotein
MPNGVGGAGVHWNAQTWRFLPTDFVLKTQLTQRYGAKFLPPDMTIQDWGVTYDEIEPHFDTFEYLCGTSGTAGNLKGQKTAPHRRSPAGPRFPSPSLLGRLQPERAAMLLSGRHPTSLYDSGGLRKGAVNVSCWHITRVGPLSP